jgi:hypothetical protein
MVLSEPADIPEALTSQALLLPERYPARIICAIGLLFALAYSASLVLFPKPNGRIVLGDALHHYVQLRSAIFDHDLHFRNEYVRMYGLTGAEPETDWIYAETETGHVRNYMPVGPALLWAPMFLLTTGILYLLNAVGFSYPIDGFGRVFQATAGVSGVIAATAGVWLTFKTCAHYTGCRAAIWACLVVWLASSAIYYSLISPTYSHAASLLVVSGFWYAHTRLKRIHETRRYVVLGALVGVAALMRWQDAILLIVPAVDLIAAKRDGTSLTRIAVLGALTLASAAVAFVPQMIVWTIIYGRPLALPQGEGFMQWSNPALVQVLFSDWHGLLTWTPVIIFCLAGIPSLYRRAPRTAIGATAFILLSWYVNAAVADWWAGEAFGSRRFVSCFPVFTLCLAALVERWAPSIQKLVLVSAVVCSHAFLLLLQYQTFMHGFRDLAPYPRGFYNLWLARFVVPFDIAARLFR